jgi:DNA-binding response OmpR family regulator
MSREKLAVYDDSVEYTRLLQKYLCYHGFHVHIVEHRVATAQASIARLHDEDIFAVLIDYFFPDGYGDDIVTAIRAVNPQIPLIGISADKKLAGIEPHYDKSHVPALGEYLESVAAPTLKSIKMIPAMAG